MWKYSWHKSKSFAIRRKKERENRWECSQFPLSWASHTARRAISSTILPVLPSASPVYVCIKTTLVLVRSFFFSSPILMLTLDWKPVVLQSRCFLRLYNSIQNEMAGRYEERTSNSRQRGLHWLTHLLTQCYWSSSGPGCSSWRQTMGWTRRRAGSSRQFGAHIRNRCGSTERTHTSADRKVHDPRVKPPPPPFVAAAQQLWCID